MKKLLTVVLSVVFCITMAIGLTGCKHDHEFETTVVEATCTEEGYTLHTCTVCGESYKDHYVKPIGHEVIEGDVSSYSTLFADGEITGKCIHCGEKVTTEMKSKVGSKIEEYLYSIKGTGYGITISDFSLSMGEESAYTVDFAEFFIGVDDNGLLYGGGQCTVNMGAGEETASMSAQAYVEEHTVYVYSEESGILFRLPLETFYNYYTEFAQSDAEIQMVFGYVNKAERFINVLTESVKELIPELKGVDIYWDKIAALFDGCLQLPSVNVETFGDLVEFDTWFELDEEASQDGDYNVYNVKEEAVLALNDLLYTKSVSDFIDFSATADGLAKLLNTTVGELLECIDVDTLFDDIDAVVKAFAPVIAYGVELFELEDLIAGYLPESFVIDYELLANAENIDGLLASFGFDLNAQFGVESFRAFIQSQFISETTIVSLIGFEGSEEELTEFIKMMIDNNLGFTVYDIWYLDVDQDKPIEYYKGIVEEDIGEIFDGGNLTVKVLKPEETEESIELIDFLMGDWEAEYIRTSGGFFESEEGDYEIISISRKDGVFTLSGNREDYEYGTYKNPITQETKATTWLYSLKIEITISAEELYFDFEDKDTRQPEGEQLVVTNLIKGTLGIDEDGIMFYYDNIWLDLDGELGDKEYIYFEYNKSEEFYAENNAFMLVDVQIGREDETSAGVIADASISYEEVHLNVDAVQAEYDNFGEIVESGVIMIKFDYSSNEEFVTENGGNLYINLYSYPVDTDFIPFVGTYEIKGNIDETSLEFEYFYQSPVDDELAKVFDFTANWEAGLVAEYIGYDSFGEVETTVDVEILIESIAKVTVTAYELEMVYFNLTEESLEFKFRSEYTDNDGEIQVFDMFVLTADKDGFEFKYSDAYSDNEYNVDTMTYNTTFYFIYDVLNISYNVEDGLEVKYNDVLTDYETGEKSVFTIVSLTWNAEEGIEFILSIEGMEGAMEVAHFTAKDGDFDLSINLEDTVSFTASGRKNYVPANDYEAFKELVDGKVEEIKAEVAEVEYELEDGKSLEDVDFDKAFVIEFMGDAIVLDFSSLTAISDGAIYTPIGLPEVKGMLIEKVRELIGQIMNPGEEGEGM